MQILELFVNISLDTKPHSDILCNMFYYQVSRGKSIIPKVFSTCKWAWSSILRWLFTCLNV